MNQNFVFEIKLRFKIYVLEQSIFLIIESNNKLKILICIFWKQTSLLFCVIEMLLIWKFKKREIFQPKTVKTDKHIT